MENFVVDYRTFEQPIEATEVQAINDFVIFSIAGAGSLISGVIFADFGKYIDIFVHSILLILPIFIITTSLIVSFSMQVGWHWFMLYQLW